MKTSRIRSFLAVTFASLLVGWAAMAQPYIVSVVPGRMAMGVPPTSTIQFTFSEAMSTATVTVMVVQGTSFQNVTVTPSWNAGKTVLTCTAPAPFPGGATVVWNIDPATSSLGIDMTPDSDFFMVSSAGTSTGCDPSATMLSFTVSKGFMYSQTSASAPTLATNTPYCFLACNTIPCPRDATNVSIRTPLTQVYNLTKTALAGHLNYLDCSSPSPAALDATYGTGGYVFTVQAAASNQAVTVNFPGTITQPAAPHLSNWAAAQAIDPTQPFSLAWDAMPDGSAADWVYVEIYGGAFKTPTLGEAGALNGTATSVLIPANTLQPSQAYSGAITFYHYQLLTNGTSHISLAYRASTTEFDLNTTAGTGASLVITNAAATIATGKFTFDVKCSPGQMVIIERSSSLLAGSWQGFYTNIAATAILPVTDNLAPGNRFYRARTGP